MSVTVNDPKLIEELLNARDSIELKDPAGKILGLFTVECLAVPPAGVTSPFSDDEMAELRKEKGTKTTAEVLAALRNLK